TPTRRIYTLSLHDALPILMTTGIDLKKDLENEEKFFAKGVNYCATCDAALYRGKNVVVIGYNEEAVEEANFTSEIVGKVTFVNKIGRAHAELQSRFDLVCR